MKQEEEEEKRRLICCNEHFARRKSFNLGEKKKISMNRFLVWVEEFSRVRLCIAFCELKTLNLETRVKEK